MFWIVWGGLATLTLGWFALRPALRESRRDWNAPLPGPTGTPAIGRTASCRNCESDDWIERENGLRECAACGTAADLHTHT